MAKILVGLGLFLLLAYLCKMYLVPFLPDLSLTEVQRIHTRELLKIFEVIAISVLLGIFVFDEILKRWSVANRKKAPEQSGSRWSDLAWIFTLVFGSFALFHGVVTFAGW